MNLLTLLFRDPQPDRSGEDRCHGCEDYEHSNSFETISPDQNLPAGHPYFRAPMLTLEGALCDSCLDDSNQAHYHNTQ